MARTNVVRSFEPNWATHPGEHIEEYLEVLGWTQAELARRAAMTPKLVSQIVSHKNPVTPDTAMKLERVLGMTAEIWLGLQSRWDLHHARLREVEAQPETKSWISSFPVAELKARGFVPETKDENKIADALCRFFGIGDPMAYPERLRNMAVRHRQSKVGEVRPDHVSAWLMLGELAIKELDLPEYSQSKFLAAVHEIRGLTCERPEVFEPRMRDLCARAGVAVVFEKPISKTRLFGSARWVNSERNAVIQMSLRMKHNDHFWWTFFHECGHVVLHSGKNFADDQNGQGDKLEAEADEWAEALLYGDKGTARILADPPGNIAEVKGQAAALNLHPGILVGMLQHHRAVEFNSPLNKLKVRFEWAADV